MKNTSLLTTQISLFKRIGLFFSLIVFFLASCCEECEFVTCVNGQCNEGVCECRCNENECWEGISCESEKTPAEVFITKISFNGFSNDDENGDRWDQGELPILSFPDIQVRVRRYDSSSWGYSSEVIYNASEANNYVINPNQPISLGTPTSQYEIALFEEDEIVVQKVYAFMERVIFNPFQSGGGFPKAIKIKSPRSNLEFNLDLEYKW